MYVTKLYLPNMSASLNVDNSILVKFPLQF